MPKISDPREQMGNQLFMRGHATVDEILTASFGEWPPKGLDIVGKNDQQVLLTPMRHYTDQDHSPLSALLNSSGLVWGIATVAGERTIGINRLMTHTIPSLFGRSVQTGRLGHEVVHVIQGDHYYRAQDTFGEEAAKRIWEQQNDLTSNTIVNDLSAHSIGVLGKALLAVKTLGTAGYNQRGAEIQAFLHQILMQGYPSWGRLPQNKEELWTALIDVGFKPPPEILSQLEASPTIAATREIFSKNVGKGIASS